MNRENPSLHRHHRHRVFLVKVGIPQSSHLVRASRRHKKVTNLERSNSTPAKNIKSSKPNYNNPTPQSPIRSVVSGMFSRALTRSLRPSPRPQCLLLRRPLPPRQPLQSLRYQRVSPPPTQTRLQSSSSSGGPRNDVPSNSWNRNRLMALLAIFLSSPTSQFPPPPND